MGQQEGRTEMEEQEGRTEMGQQEGRTEMGVDEAEVIFVPNFFFLADKCFVVFSQTSLMENEEFQE